MFCFKVKNINHISIFKIYLFIYQRLSFTIPCTRRKKGREELESVVWHSWNHNETEKNYFPSLVEVWEHVNDHCHDEHHPPPQKKQKKNNKTIIEKKLLAFSSRGPARSGSVLMTIATVDTTTKITDTIETTLKAKWVDVNDVKNSFKSKCLAWRN